jgi:hypothetical protein
MLWRRRISVRWRPALIRPRKCLIQILCEPPSITSHAPEGHVRLVGQSQSSTCIVQEPMGNRKASARLGKLLHGCVRTQNELTVIGDCDTSHMPREGMQIPLSLRPGLFKASVRCIWSSLSNVRRYSVSASGYLCVGVGTKLAPQNALWQLLWRRRGVGNCTNHELVVHHEQYCGDA